MHRWLILSLLLLGGCAAPAPAPPVAAAAGADLAQLAGEWYVVASLPDGDAHKVGRRFALEPAGPAELVLYSRYYEPDFEQPEQTVRGRVRIADPPANVHWQVQLGWSGQDWIVLAADPAAGTMLLGAASRAQAWLLSRERMVGDDRFLAVQDLLTARGYDGARLRRVAQGSAYLGAPGFHGSGY